MLPKAEMVHWLFATGILFIGLCLLSEAIVGTEVWRRRPWRKYLWPGIAFTLGLLLWPVMAFFTNSAIHMYAHGRLKSRWWRLTMPLAFVVTGTAFIVHEQNAWFFARSAFLHHLLGWTFVIAAVVPLLMVWRPRSPALQSFFALSIVLVAVMLYCDRDVAPVFGHLSPLAGAPHR